MQGLQARGAVVDAVAAYDSRCPERADPAVIRALLAGEVSMLSFTSSKTVRYFWQLVQAAGVTAAEFQQLQPSAPKPPHLY
ncbi:MAG: hypothetical protein HC926_01210 [Synechococcaceae cyanobacterium SM2_3_60]|nr:hypothetical protein [Synechococcaceae cyanobacterium SM2_3_60]